MIIFESNKLMKVYVTYYEGFWTFRPETDRHGKPLREKEIRFRGGVEECIYALQLISAKDADIAPAGRLRRAYPALAKDLMEGFSKYIWVSSSDWKRMRQYI